MQQLLFVVALIAILVIGIRAMRHSVRAGIHRTQIPAQVEYWIYLPTERAPLQDDLMKIMVATNSADPNRPTAITAREGMIFSDIRLLIELTLRSRSPHVFRPDLLMSLSGTDSGNINGLAAAQSMLRVRYVSREQLADYRHLTFMPYLAHASMKLGDGIAVLDVGRQRLMDPDQFTRWLTATTNLESFESNVTIQVVEDDEYRRIVTTGMVTIGLRELRTLPLQADAETVAKQVVEELARRCWDQRTEIEDMMVDLEFDSFRGYVQGRTADTCELRIQRITKS
ncbi:MAG: hypothetical protein JNM85_05390 [Chthonomonas sp.]|nr:hypothetical protein [Chthonomonas sp.]